MKYKIDKKENLKVRILKKKKFDFIFKLSRNVFKKHKINSKSKERKGDYIEFKYRYEAENEISIRNNLRKKL